MKANFMRETMRLVGEIADNKKKAQLAGVQPYFTPFAEEVTKLLMHYVYSCAWQNTPKTKKLMQTIRMSTEKAAAALGVSPNTVRSARSQASALLYKEFGGDVFDAIRNNNEARLKDLHFKLTYKIWGYENAMNYIPRSIIDEAMDVRRSSNKSYSFKECIKELRFLAKYDLRNMHAILNTLNRDKLAFILEILMDCSTCAKKGDKETLIRGLLNSEKQINEKIGL